MIDLNSFLINRRHPRNKRIIVLHIAKTAGTSLRRLLQDEFGKKMIYPGDYHLKRQTKGGYIIGEDIVGNFPSLPPHKVLIGHFSAHILEFIPKNYLAACFLRDPIQRSLSTVAHFCRILNNQGQNVSPSDLLNDSEFLENHINDFQTRVLGEEIELNPNKTRFIDEQMLCRALKRIETIPFVGITEFFEESCRLFDSFFSTRISRFHRRENVTRPQGGELSEFIPLVENLVRRDWILYNAAIDKFQRSRSAMKQNH